MEANYATIVVTILVVVGLGVGAIGLLELSQPPCQEGYYVSIHHDDGVESSEDVVAYDDLPDDAQRVFRSALHASRSESGDDVVLHPTDHPGTFSESLTYVRYRGDTYRLATTNKWYGCPPNYGPELLLGGLCGLLAGATVSAYGRFSA
ncbi:hypothetical protein [Halosolutus halophilus]|uniref:hypothetical protein n=1 Tax=Halosolutus halophilus TaxID=1552990 RepID=UPI002234F04F|nr:hypothetical protein [Halosolutus halophilus]